MATWNGNKNFYYTKDLGMDSVESSKTWEYHTTSDYLRIYDDQGTVDGFIKSPAKQTHENYQRDEALALLECLMDWSDRFIGTHHIDNILKRMRNKNEN